MQHTKKTTILYINIVANVLPTILRLFAIKTYNHTYCLLSCMQQREETCTYVSLDFALFRQQLGLCCSQVVRHKCAHVCAHSHKYCGSLTPIYAQTPNSTQHYIHIIFVRIVKEGEEKAELTRYALCSAHHFPAAYGMIRESV